MATRKTARYKPKSRNIKGKGGDFTPKPAIDPETLRRTKGASISLISSDMKVMWANSVLGDIYGKLPDLRGQTCYKAYHGRKSICPDCIPARAMKSKSIATDIIKRKARDGTIRYLQSVCIPFLGKDGEVSCTIEVLFDVTKGKLLEFDLAKSEEFYRILFEHSGTAIAVNDRDGTITSVNRTFCELAGFKREEIEGKKNYLEFVKDKERVSKIHEKRWSSKGRSPTKYEYIFLTGDKKERFVDISINRIPSTSLSIASMIDNTEKKFLESEVREKEQFLANILRESADAIIVLDNQRLIKTWNKGAEQIFGYRPEEIIGKRFELLVPADLIEGRELEKLRKQVLETGYVRNYITERMRKDKRKVIIAETATLIKDPDEKPIGRAIILRDITERVRLERQLQQTEKMTAIGTLSASLAHEIKNPLNSIVINMEILKGHMQKSLSEPDRVILDKYVGSIQSEVKRLDRVIKDFLNYARPQSMLFKEVNLNAVIGNVVELVSAQAEKAGVEVRLELDDKLFRIHGDENQLKQIILNLVLNGLHAMDRGGRLSIRTRNSSGGEVELSVQDTGSGIKEEHKANIFDLFFTTKKDGSGLGLPTALQLIKNHSGRIDFESEPGKGTIFHISFPAA